MWRPCTPGLEAELSLLRFDLVRRTLAMSIGDGMCRYSGERSLPHGGPMMPCLNVDWRSGVVGGSYCRPAPARQESAIAMRERKRLKMRQLQFDAPVIKLAAHRR